jgi:hypothetical protein
VGLAIESVSTDVQTLTESFGQTATTIQEYQQNTMLAIEGFQQSQDSAVRLLEAKVEQLRLESAENSGFMFLAGQQNSLLPPSSIAIQLSMQQRTMCVPSCVCLCHRWRQLRSPKVFERLIGSLIIGYSGVPLITKNCTVKSCKVKATYALKVNYRFPVWMLARAVLFAVSNQYGQPTAGLSVARIRPHSSLVFSFAESGNVAGLKHIFDHHLASPFDISAQTGDYPLHVSDPNHYAPPLPYRVLTT